MLNEKVWLKRQFNDGDIFSLDVNYLLEHLTFEDVVKSSTNSDYWRKKGNISARNFLLWQEGKEARLEKTVTKLKDPMKLEPIQVALHPTLEMYSVINGISRLRYFSKHQISDIYLRLYHGCNFDYTTEYSFFSL